MTPERNAKGARKSSRGLIPTERRRRRRLAEDARNPNPRDPRTYTTTPTRRRERSGLGHLTMPRGPSEAEETAVSADGTEVAFFPPLSTVAGLWFIITTEN